MKTVYQMTDTVGADDLKSEDGDAALIFDGYNASELIGDGCLFVRLQSWDAPDCVHPLLNSMIGKKIRITVEVED